MPLRTKILDQLNAYVGRYERLSLQPSIHLIREIIHYLINSVLLFQVVGVTRINSLSMRDTIPLTNESF